MKVIVWAALAVALTATTASGQRMGSVNRNAPNVKQSIELDGGKVELNYAAITWAEGRWAAALADEATREKWRSRINSSVAERPLGSFTCSADLQIGDKTVPAGSYKLGFTLDEKYQWQLTLIAGEESMSFPLKLGQSPKPSRRLVLAIYAGEAEGSIGLYLGFGEHMGDVIMTPKSTG